MLMLRTIAEVRKAVALARHDGRRIGFVPTMGALHAGHVSLIAASRAADDYTLVSIYVNPKQFGPNEDYSSYPRTFETDLAVCREQRVDTVFAPSDAEMYPTGEQTRVRPGALADALCGSFRPGHFEGVCTVVAKLFHIVQPDVAYFGQKDAQQAIVIRQMVRDLSMPIAIEVCPTVRDPDGLALSSRNARLSPSDRPAALSLYRALCHAREALTAGQVSMGRIIAEMRAIIAAFAAVKVDYLSIVDADTLEGVTVPAGKLLVAGAIRVGEIRLIDNLIVELPAP